MKKVNTMKETNSKESSDFDIKKIEKQILK